ncbi:unnamed protein product [Sympodiomycopsis kandeliae]
MAVASTSTTTSSTGTMSHKNFTSFGLSPPLLRSLSHLAISVPTPIQSLTIPTILSGCDLIGGSPTGTGKTLCFALPILHSLLKDPVGGHSVVLTPTRELAMQLYEQFLAISQGAKMGIKISLILGGMDMMKQANELSRGRPHILVATPGRLMDLLRSGGNSEWGLDRCKYLVLDEADRLLTDTFAEALGEIMDVLPPSSRRQTLLFSATLTPEIEAMAAKRLEEANAGTGKEIKVEKIEFDAKTPKNLRQRYVFIPSHVREVYLYHLLTHSPSLPRSQVRSRRTTAIQDRKGKGKGILDESDEEDGNEEEEEDVGEQVTSSADDDDDDDDEDEDEDEDGSEEEVDRSDSEESINLDYSTDEDASDTEFIDDQGTRYRRVVPTIIFVSRCQTAELLTRTLRSLGLPALSLHSQLSQSTRTANLNKFRRESSRWILISTDVGSRGLDIPSVEMVINFDLPLAYEDYIHRVGRTARAGRIGWAVSFIGQRDITVLQGIEEKINLKLKELEMPEERVLQMLNKVSTAKREATMLLNDIGFGERSKRNSEKSQKSKRRDKGEQQKMKSKKVKTSV